MKVKSRLPKKHSGTHNDILYFLMLCIDLGDDDYKKAAWRIHDEEWMSPDSKTGSDYKSLEVDCKRTWDKAILESEAGPSKEKRLKEFEKLKIATDFVNNRVKYDTFLGQHLADGKITSPAAEYTFYNSTASDLTYIEKHFFHTVFEVNNMTETNTLKEWGNSLPAWDKKDWVAKLIQYIPTKDKKQAKLFITGWLIRSYVQAVNPNNLDATSIVNRWFLILCQHKQDSGKSSFLNWLSPNLEWSKLSGLEDNKDGYIALTRYMFIQDDELGGLSRVQQHERIKAMISTAKVDVRPPYGKTDVSLPRTASFCGSTNNDAIFPAAEGTSRFLALPLDNEDFDWEGYKKNINKVKLWAQVKHLSQTDWLAVNSPAIMSYRQATNQELVTETVEEFVINQYLEPSKVSGQVVLTGEVLEYCMLLGHKNLGMKRLGQELKNAFGPRITGITSSGEKRCGYSARFKASVAPQHKIPSK